MNFNEYLQETISKKLPELYQEGMQACLDLECGFYFVMDSVITLTSEEVLKDLVHWNRSVITTQLTQPGQVNRITFTMFL